LSASSVTPAAEREAPVATARPIGTWVAQAVLIVISAYIFLESRSLGIWTDGGPGPGFFPLVLSIALAALSVVWFIQTRRDASEAKPGENHLGRQAAITTASLILLASLLNVLGFQLALLLFLLFHLRVMGRVRWVTSLAVAVLGSVGAFHLFNDLLMVSLPVASVPPLNWLGV
jgi:hypothetical protein